MPIDKLLQAFLNYMKNVRNKLVSRHTNCKVIKINKKIMIDIIGGTFSFF